MKLTDSQKRIYDVLNRTNLTDRDKAILISQLQEKLVSGENISTINGEDITKGGNIEIDNKSSEIYYTNMLLSIDSSSSNLTDDDINQYIGSWDGLINALKNNIPIFDKIKIEDSSLNQFGIIPIVAAITDDNSVDLAMFIGVDNSYRQFKIIKVSDNNYSILFAKKVILDTDNNADLLIDNKTIIGAINELDSAVKPYIVDLTALLAAQDSETISAVIGGIDNLNGTVQQNRVIFGTLANGTVAVGIRVLGNQTTLTYFVDSVVGLTVNEIIITNTSGTLTKTANTHAVLTENMVVDNLESDEATLPLSAAQGKALSEKVKSTYQKINDSTLSTNAKTVVGAINENTGNITRINRAVGNPVIEEVDLTQIAEAGYFWPISGVKVSNAKYSLVRVTLQKGDLLIASVLSSYGIAQLTVVDEAGANAVELVPSSEGKSSLIVTSSYYANKDCKVDISQYGTGTFPRTKAYIIKSPLNTAISDNSYMQYLHKVYEEYGAVYNKETGYWELNGLIDLTEEDMWDIWLWTGCVINSPSLQYAFKSAPIRTTFHTSNTASYRELDNSLDLNSAFMFCANLEVIRLNKEDNQVLGIIGNTGYAMHNAFNGCKKLRNIEDIIRVASSYNIFSATFNNCFLLHTIRLKYLQQRISFQDSPLLSYESINYLITNAANPEAITVTVHPTTYSYLTGTAQPTTEVGGTTEEWQALVTTAQGKQITFAVA